MNRYFLRPLFYISLLMIILMLDYFTNLNSDLKVLIAFISALVILGIYILKTSESKTLKIFILVFLFIGIPPAILYFTGIMNSIPSPWNGFLMVFVVTVCGMCSVLALIKFNMVDVYIM